MDRITLALLEVTDGTLPAARLPLEKGLNVLSGVENRGKTFAFGCLDFLMGASAPPDPNPHSRGYELASLYHTVNGTRRGAVRRHLASGKAAFLPVHPTGGDVPSSGWVSLRKKHTAQGESLSSYWLRASGFSPTLLRSNMSGDVSAFTVRFLAHLVLVDELRIMEKRSPALSSQKTANPADIDALALVLGARRNPPPPRTGRVAAPEPAMSADLREFIGREIERLDEQIEALSATTDADADEVAEMTRQATAFTAAADEAARELRRILGEMEEAQQNLMSARAQTKSSREITARLELLQAYYASDLRRLEAVAETAFLLEQLSPVPCPTCDQPLPVVVSPPEDIASKEYLGKVRVGAAAEAAKIRNLRRDLDRTLALARADSRTATADEETWAAQLTRLRESERRQSTRVAEVHARLNETFAAVSQLAQRQALKQRKADLVTRLAEGIAVSDTPAPNTPAEERTDFDPGVVREFCDRVRDLLVAWRWDYTSGPVEVAFDPATADISISGSPRRSFGKAVRALATSAFIVAVMDHCLAKGLPHPGFVVLDSPLTTKKEGGTSAAKDEQQVSDEIVTAFFTHLATDYADRQVLVIDNKEPPKGLEGRFNHIRFGDDRRATRRGFFPG